MWLNSGKDVNAELSNSFKRIFGLFESVINYKTSHSEIFNQLFQRFMLFATESLPFATSKTYFEFLIKENRDWSSWREFINFETRNGNLKAAQSLFKRAKNMAYNEGQFSTSIILHDWLIWEKLHGSWEGIQSVNLLIFENSFKTMPESLIKNSDSIKEGKKRLHEV